MLMAEVGGANGERQSERLVEQIRPPGSLIPNAVERDACFSRRKSVPNDTKS